MKVLKWLLVGTGSLVLVGLAFLIWFITTFDPNVYKPRIVALVKERTGRTLAIDGKIGLSLFPTLGVNIRQVTLSEPNSPQVFARADDVRVGVALLPLLVKTVQVNRVILNGFTVDLVRYKDGHTNFDDLTGQTPPAVGGPVRQPGQATGGPPLAVTVGGIAIEHAAIGWRDEQGGTTLRLHDLMLQTGPLANNVPGTLEFEALVDGLQPTAHLRVRLETGYRLNLATAAVTLSSLKVRATGDAAGFTGIDANLIGEQIEADRQTPRIIVSGLDVAAKSTDGLEATLAIPQLQLTPVRIESQAIRAGLTLARPTRTVTASVHVAPLTTQGQQVGAARLAVDFTATQGDLTAQGALASSVTADFATRQVALPEIAGELGVTGGPGPRHTLRSTLKGVVRADWGTQNATADLQVQSAPSNLHVALTVAHWAQPALAFMLAADRINLDALMAAMPHGAAPTGNRTVPAPDKPFDLSPIQGLNATGDVRVGSLQVAQIQAEDVALHLQAAGGRLALNPISARLYQGALAGSASVTATDDRFALKQRLTGVSVGPLLRDALHQDLLDGRGNVALDVTSSGTSVASLKQALAGTASLALRDGTLKGIDLTTALHAAEAALGSTNAFEQQAQSGASTDFTELTATFSIQNGVAHNDDLRVKSPFLRLAGQGDIDIARGTLDYTTEASVVAAAAGQGGSALDHVAGVTIPVQATGPFANLRYRIDVKALARELAKGAVQRFIRDGVGGGPASPAGGGGPNLGNVLHSLGGLFGNSK